MMGFFHFVFTKVMTALILKHHSENAESRVYSNIASLPSHILAASGCTGTGAFFALCLACSLKFEFELSNVGSCPPSSVSVSIQGWFTWLIWLPTCGCRWRQVWVLLDSCYQEFGWSTTAGAASSVSVEFLIHFHTFVVLNLSCFRCPVGQDEWDANWYEHTRANPLWYFSWLLSIRPAFWFDLRFRCESKIIHQSYIIT